MATAKKTASKAVAKPTEELQVQAPEPEVEAVSLPSPGVSGNPTPDNLVNPAHTEDDDPESNVGDEVTDNG